MFGGKEDESCQPDGMAFNPMLRLAFLMSDLYQTLKKGFISMPVTSSMICRQSSTSALLNAKVSRYRFIEVRNASSPINCLKRCKIQAPF